MSVRGGQWSGAGRAARRRSGALLLAVVGLAVVTPVASAQDRWRLDPPDGGRVDRRFPRGAVARGATKDLDGPATMGFEAMLRAYGAASGGSAVASSSALTDVEYDDVFGAGTGVGAVAFLPFHLREFGERRVEFAVGPMFAVDTIGYPGRRYLDLSGDAIEPDALRLTTAIAGVHLRLRLGRESSPVKFVLGAHLGLGVAFLGEVDAVIESPSSGVRSGTVFDATTTGAFELGVRVGISGQPSRWVDLSLVLYLGIDVVGAPRDGDLSSAALRPDAGAMLNGVAGLALSVALRFPATAESSSRRR